MQFLLGLTEIRYDQKSVNTQNWIRRLGLSTCRNMGRRKLCPIWLQMSTSIGWEPCVLVCTLYFVRYNEKTSFFEMNPVLPRKVNFQVKTFIQCNQSLTRRPCLGGLKLLRNPVLYFVQNSNLVYFPSPLISIQSRRHSSSPSFTIKSCEMFPLIFV